LGVSVRATREAAVELRLHEGRHVDAVDEQAAIPLEQPGRIDLGRLDLDPPPHHPGPGGTDETRVTEVHVGERRTVQVVGWGELGHASSSSSDRMVAPEVSMGGRGRQAPAARCGWTGGHQWSADTSSPATHTCATSAEVAWAKALARA